MADTKFGTLQKLLVRVASDKCATFRSTYTTDAGASRKTDYDGKVVFLEDKKEIFTHGVIYGTNTSSELQLLKDILRDYIDGDSIKAHNGYTYVGKEIEAIVDAIGTSNLIDFTYDTTKGYVLTDTASLKTLDNNKITLAGGDSSYSTSLGNAIEVADTKEDIQYSYGTKLDVAESYIAATSYAIKSYVEWKLGDLANALRFRGGDEDLAKEIAATNLTDMNVGDMYVSQRKQTITLQDGKGTYSLEIGDSFIVTKVENGKVTEGVVVERSVDGTVTTTGSLTNNHVVLGAGEQGVKDSDFILGSDDTAAADFGKTTYTLATEKSVYTYVGAAINGALDDLDSAATYSDILSYSYQQTDGLVTYVKVSYTAADAIWDKDAHTLTDAAANGFITKAGSDALHSYITYVASLVDEQDHSVTTVDTYNATYISVSYEVTGTGNDYAYTVKAEVSLMNDYVGIVYDEEEGKWKTEDGEEVKHALADAADVAETIIADEKVIAAALNDHESRISTLENATATVTSDAVEGITTTVTTTGGVVTAVSMSVDPADVTYVSGATPGLTYTSGVLDESAVSAIKDYVDAKTAALDESYTSVVSADPTRLNVTYSVSGNDYTYYTYAKVATVSDDGEEYKRTLTADTTNGKLLDSDAIDNIASYAYNVANDAAAKAVDDLDVAKQTVKDSDNKGTNLSFSYSETDGIVTIDELSYTAASVSTSYLVVTAADNGFVTGYILQETINNLDPWEEY